MTAKWFFVLFLICSALQGAVMDSAIIAKTQAALVEKYGEEQRTRITVGVQQVAALWRESDGDAKQFQQFCVQRFIADPDTLRMTFQRMQRNLEIIQGHSHEIDRSLKMPVEVVMDPLLPVDYLFAEYDPFAHIQDDLFNGKIAFVCLLNFPIYSLEEKLALGPGWGREQWAEARLTDTFDSRVPAEVSQELSRGYVQADDYIANYNIFMHNLLDAKGKRPFPAGLKLITHWGLRDELKSQYADADGLARQKMIFAVMEHIIHQDIPQAVINSDQYDWDPISNKVFKDGSEQSLEREKDVRYEKLLQIFHAEQKLDGYSPLLPTKMDRQFKKNREIPEEQFEALITSVLKAPVGKDAAKLISKRLKRPLQPFDIWYNGFKANSNVNEAELDQLVAAKYPNVAAFQEGLPAILTSLGFDERTAEFLQSKITVDPSRGAGHANGAMRRDDNAHLRTRIPAGGMNYKGFNIAVHELGHNVEQVFSLNKMDQYLLNGVPNNAFTEAFAFVFQSRDLALLGVEKPSRADDPLKALDVFWSSCEIGAVGLVDMRLWRWMYAHPEARPAEVKQAAIAIATDVWNEFLYPMTGIKDCDILAVYSHMIAFGLYLPDYFLGQLIMFQIEDYLHDKNLGQEMERMCRLGRLTPDAWMRAAVGAPVSAAPLIEAAQQAVGLIKK
jgi:hypothetical protein